MHFKVVSCREEEGRVRIISEKGKEAVLWQRNKTDYFPDRDGCAVKRVLFGHPQRNFQLYLKFAKWCVKCYGCCLSPEN